MLSRMFSWLKRFFKNPKEIGSVAPSSPALGELMTEGLASDARVLELGPGDGAITEHILKKLTDASRLTLVESDAELADICSKRFPGAKVVHADVETVLRSDAGMFDAIISGIPFVNMDEHKRNRVFGLIKQRLSPDGHFVMFQYTITTRDELSRIFGHIETRFTPWNVPPAFVFIAKKSGLGSR